jgi:hypothetical protein
MMTWTKQSDDFGDQCAHAGLSDAAFRLHIEGLLWTLRRETGGLISRRDLARLSDVANPASALAELLAVGFWLVHGDGWRIDHHMAHQPEPGPNR